MLKDYRIKKKVQDEMKPEKSFDAFCEENNIRVNSVAKKVWRKRFVPILASFAVMAVIALSITLPLLTKGRGTENIAPAPPSPTRYAENDIENLEMTTEELAAIPDLRLFDFNNVEQYSMIYRITPIGVSDLTLGYCVQDVLYGYFIADELYAYSFDYLIRTYPAYDFINSEQFAESENQIVNNNIQYGFTIVENIESPKAYITFAIGNKEYFVTVEEFEGITAITKQNIEAFIENVF